jgi:putative DNA primase/helicase
MTAREFLAGLENVRAVKCGWQARCPAHDDKIPSLSVSEHDGKILLHCHAGCSVKDIL